MAVGALKSRLFPLIDMMMLLIGLFFILLAKANFETLEQQKTEAPTAIPWIERPETQEHLQNLWAAQAQQPPDESPYLVGLVYNVPSDEVRLMNDDGSASDTVIKDVYGLATHAGLDLNRRASIYVWVPRYSVRGVYLDTIEEAMSAMFEDQSVGRFVTVTRQSSARRTPPWIPKQ